MPFSQGRGGSEGILLVSDAFLELGGRGVSVKPKARRPIRLWGGYVNGHLDTRFIDTGFGGWVVSKRWLLPYSRIGGGPRWSTTTCGP